METPAGEAALRDVPLEEALHAVDQRVQEIGDGERGREGRHHPAQEIHERPQPGEQEDDSHQAHPGVLEDLAHGW
jgi:hypothetical protein